MVLVIRSQPPKLGSFVRFISIVEDCDESYEI